MNVKPGDIVYCEPCGLHEIDSFEAAQDIDTAYCVIELHDGTLAAVMLRGAYVSVEGCIINLQAIRFDVAENWHQTQAEANKASFDSYHKLYAKCIGKLDKARKFLFPDDKEDSEC